MLIGKECASQNQSHFILIKSIYISYNLSTQKKNNMAQQFIYTLVTDQGDKHYTTENPHTHHNSSEEWFRNHRERINLAFNLAHLGVKIIAVYTGHNRSGQRII